MNQPATLFRRARGFFAPVDRATGTPTLFDPSRHLASGAPPAPWVDAGWIENFRRASETRLPVLRSGPRSAPAAQCRAQLEARVEFDFRCWGKLQMALSGGSQHMNVLAAQANADPRPSGGIALPAVAVLSGSSAEQIVVGAGAVSLFVDGDVVAVDRDYLQQTGYVGTGIAGAYVNDPLDVGRDLNYVRRVTFNVGRVASRTATALVLAQPLLGGVPASGAAVQKVIAFVDREGGSFFQEWSGLFLFEDEAGGRICLHYPRLRPAAPAREEEWEIAAPLRGLAQQANFTAVPYGDVNDGEQALCYRSLCPAPGVAVY